MNDLPKAPNQPLHPELRSTRRKKLPILIMVLGLILLLALTWYVWQKGNEDKSDVPSSGFLPELSQSERPKGEPSLTTEAVVSGHANIWDTAFPDSDTIIYTTRGGEIWGYSLKSKDKWQISKLANVRAEGEGGLLGMTLDSQFSENGFGFICYNATGSPRTVRVARFKLSADRKTLSEMTEIITDIESQAGRHSGCRLAMNKQDDLWVVTGDSALRNAPQNPKSLAGKVLRVDRDGKPVEGNLTASFDTRIFSYGHRNLQGIALFASPAPNGALGLTSEHGPGEEDEINWLLPGNFGWDPAGPNAGYDESVPMTDKVKYPDAIEAVWNSGPKTIAISGLTILGNEHWADWYDRTIVTVLKDKHLRLLDIGRDGKVNSEKELFKNEFGRIRSAHEGPDGSLYITTDNGADDKIIKISPTTTF